MEASTIYVFLLNAQGEHCAFKHPAIIQTDRNQHWNHKEYVNYTSFLNLTPVWTEKMITFSDPSDSILVDGTNSVIANIASTV